MEFVNGLSDRLPFLRRASVECECSGCSIEIRDCLNTNALILETNLQILRQTPKLFDLVENVRLILKFQIEILCQSASIST